MKSYTSYMDENGDVHRRWEDVTPESEVGSFQPLVPGGQSQRLQKSGGIKLSKAEKRKKRDVYLKAQAALTNQIILDFKQIMNDIYASSGDKQEVFLSKQEALAGIFERAAIMPEKATWWSYLGWWDLQREWRQFCEAYGIGFCGSKS